MKILNQQVNLMILLSVFLAGPAAAQASVEVYNESDNTMVFRLKSNNKLTSPHKIFLVYDSNIIAFESTSPVLKKLTSKRESKVSSYKTSSALSAALELEDDDDIKIEDWMLKPFTKTTDYESYITEEAEEEDIPLEPWMSDLSLWR